MSETIESVTPGPGPEEIDAQTLAKAPTARALTAFNLQKSYGRRRVVDDVTLHVEPGEVVGLLGANGAGKTTTF